MIELPRVQSRARLRVPVRSQRVNPAAGGAGLGQLSQLAEASSQFLFGMAEQQAEARRVADLVEATGTATRQLNDLELTFERDTDFRTAPARFLEQAEAIGTATLEGIEDRAVRTLFERDYLKSVETKLTSVKRKAWDREVQDSVARLDLLLPEYTRLAAAAENDVERQQIIGRARAAIAGFEAAGYITAPDAVARAQGLLSDIDQAEVRNLITFDPDAAVDALLDDGRFQNLDELARARLTDTAVARADSLAKEQARLAEKAERALEKAQQERAEALMKEAYALHQDGELTREAVEGFREEVGASDYRNLLRLVDPATDSFRDDPEAVQDLQGLLAEEPERAADLAGQLHREGLISNDRYIATTNAARNLARQTGPRSEYERSRSFLQGALDPGPFVQDPLGRQRAAEALQVFDDYAASGTRSDEELRRRALEIRDQFALVRLSETLVGLPHPRFGFVRRTPGDLDGIEADVSAAEAATAARLRAGEIDEAEARTEAVLLQRWRDFLARERAKPPETGGRR